MSTTRAKRIVKLLECPCTGRNLDKLIQPAVLALLAGESMHGYRLVQRLGRMSMFKGHEPDTTGVYRFLKAMEKRGLVASAWDLSASGPAKRCFELTATGRKCLALWGTTLTDYQKQVGELTKAVRAAAGRTGRSGGRTQKRTACCASKKMVRKGRTDNG